MIEPGILLGAALLTVAALLVGLESHGARFRRLHSGACRELRGRNLWCHRHQLPLSQNRPPQTRTNRLHRQHRGLRRRRDLWPDTPIRRTARLSAIGRCRCNSDRVNYSMKYPTRIVILPREFWSVLVLLIVGLFGTVVATGQVSSGSSTNPRIPTGKGTLQVTVQPALPCKSAGLPPLQPSQPGTGHHKVTLSWNAGAPSPVIGSKAVGYCLYRSQTQGAAKLKPTCSQCEPVNLVPFVGTSCIDDIVKDGAMYYYVVTAVNAEGTPSSPSNEAPASIPPANQTNSVSVKSSTPPSCREASAAR